MDHRGERIFGLDLMRAVAIALVVLVHATDLLAAHWPGPSWAGRIDGVDLFFVLSGYLVGGILLRFAEDHGRPWHIRLLDFWQRRWLRTLPNYYLFLLVNLLLAWTHVSQGIVNVNTLAYLVFLQNFHVPLDLFYWESWSLAVEEWSYLLLPVLVFAAIRVFRSEVRTAFLSAALVMIAVPAALRLGMAPGVRTLDARDLYVRWMVPTRLDTIGFGVLAAWCHRFLAGAWARMRLPALLAGGAGLWAATAFQQEAHLYYLTTWSFTCGGAAIALFLPVLSAWRSSAGWTGPVAFISRISYALYLVHLPLRYLFLRLVEGRSTAGTVLLYGTYLALCILAAAA
ncbi:MAG: acyltransferase, partial [Bacteroidetes bacterium]|nr:acyltransferase [Bacteroidota bacterium]